MFHPSRGGVRGGKDQFNWDDVKSDKDRENYLGHSLKAPVGRWQKGKDLLWYTREKGGTPMTAADVAASEDEQRRQEIQRIKDDEEQSMREALGLAPKRQQKPTGHIDKKDAEQLFKREKQEEEGREGERVKGLGFGPVAHVEGSVQGEQLAGTVEGDSPPAPAHLDAVGTAGEERNQRDPADVMPPPPPPGPPSAAAVKEQRRDERKKRKEERRAAKKARKEERKQRKEERKRRRELESSDDSDSDVSRGNSDDSPGGRKKRRKGRSPESSGTDKIDEELERRDKKGSERKSRGGEVKRGRKSRGSESSEDDPRDVNGHSERRNGGIKSSGGRERERDGRDDDRSRNHKALRHEDDSRENKERGSLRSGDRLGERLREEHTRAGRGEGEEYAFERRDAGRNFTEVGDRRKGREYHEGRRNGSRRDDERRRR